MSLRSYFVVSVPFAGVLNICEAKNVSLLVQTKNMCANMFFWSESPRVDTDVIHVIKWSRPSPSVFAYCKRSKTGRWEGLGTRLGVSYLPVPALWKEMLIIPTNKKSWNRTQWYRNNCAHKINRINFIVLYTPRERLSTFKHMVRSDISVNIKGQFAAYFEVPTWLMLPYTMHVIPQHALWNC